jgi:hypothetical protein
MVIISFKKFKTMKLLILISTNYKKMIIDDNTLIQSERLEKMFQNNLHPCFYKSIFLYVLHFFRK